mgnify:CR=1 FL=1
MNDLINLGLGDATLIAILGYAVVFVGLILLMCVVMAMGRVMIKKAAKAPEPAAEAAPAPAEAPKQPAPGSAGELKLYDTDPKDAAMIMAIVADTLGKPLNELRFISIKEVNEDEI